MKKRYCIFAAQFLPHTGGVERYTYNLAKKLIERGNEVTVVTSNVGDYADFEKMDGIRIYRMPTWCFMNGRFPVLKPNRKLRKMHRKIFNVKYDTFIIQTRFYFHSLYGMFMAKKQRATCITIDHGTGHMLTGNKAADKIGEVYEHLLTKVETCFCRQFYGVSGESVKWLKHFGIRARGIMYNSVDFDGIVDLYQNTDIDYRADYKVPEQAVVVTYTGRLVREKGSLTLIEAVKELKKEFPELYLFIAGDGEIQKEVEAAQNEYIYALGKIDFEHIIALLKGTDIFCLPTEYPEGFPTSTLEAMACKCFPVVTPRGGARELIPASEFGCVMENGSKEVLKRHLKKVLNMKEERKTVAENAYDRVKKHFTWDNVADKVESIK